MKQIFIELFNYRDGWRALQPSTRDAYVHAVLAAVQKQTKGGIEVISWGFNDPATDRRAPYDFCCVYITPSAEAQRGFEAEIRGSGWYEYFEQVNVSGAMSVPGELLQSLARLDTAISRRTSPSN